MEVASRTGPRRPTPTMACSIAPREIGILLLFPCFAASAHASRDGSGSIAPPRADPVQASRDIRGEEGTTTVEIHHRRSTATFSCPVQASGGACREEDHWRAAVPSKDPIHESLRAQLQAEANLSLEDHVDPQSGRRLSKQRVMLRADGMAPCGLVERVMDTCWLVGIYKVEVGSADPPTVSDEKFDTLLPKREEVAREGEKEKEGKAEPTEVPEIRVAMNWDAARQETTRKFRDVTIAEDDQLLSRIKQTLEGYARLGHTDIPVVIEAERNVPWKEVTRVVDLAKRSGIDKVEFAFGAKPSSRPR